MDASPILDIYYKLHKDCRNEVIEKFIIFDHATELAFIYSTDKRLPAKLYIDPSYGDLKENSVPTYAAKNGYLLAVSMYMDCDGEEEHGHRIKNNQVICNVRDFKMHMENVRNKFNLYASDDHDCFSMCLKLNTCMKLYQ